MTRPTIPNPRDPSVVDYAMPGFVVAILVWIAWLACGCGVAAGREPDLQAVESERFVQRLEVSVQSVPGWPQRIKVAEGRGNYVRGIMQGPHWWSAAIEPDSGFYPVSDGRRYPVYYGQNMNYYGGQWHYAEWCFGGNRERGSLFHATAPKLDYEITIED